MKLSRKLLPALAMLLVSAVMMSTASFAWFSSNQSADVQGMKIQVAAATTLLIKDKDDASAPFLTSVNMNVTDKTGVVPVSADAVATPTFFKMDNAGNNMSPDNYAAGTDSSFVEDDGSNYIKKTVTLRATGDTLDDIKVSVAVTDNSSSPIDPSIRVMLVYAPAGGGEAVVLYYAPLTGAQVNPAVTGYSAGSITYADAAPDLANATEEFIIENIEADTEYDVTMYIWYEGQDGNCKATNAIDLGDLTPVITFSLGSKT